MSLAREALYTGATMHERQEIEALPSLLRGVHTFVDVGASLGQYTRCAARHMRNGHIFAIEADQNWFDPLKSAAREWSASSGNEITPVHAAATDRAGEISFFVNGEISGAGFVHKGPDYDNPAVNWQEVKVAAITLDDLLKDAQPDLIKIDVEGFEYRVLLGAARILRYRHCRFLVEVHPWGDPTLGKKPEDVFALFYAAGYDFRRVHRHWLFAPSKNEIWRSIKFRAITFIMRNAGLKKALKRMVLKVDNFKRP
jgi:FkbM family methyltransferase